MLFQEEEPILYHSIFLINIKNSPGVITSISKEAKSLIFLVTIQSIPAIFAELNCKASSKSLDCKATDSRTTLESTDVTSTSSCRLSNTEYNQESHWYQERPFSFVLLQ